MRHRRATKKLGRNTSHRRALLRNLVTSLIMEERLETTPAKAKAMRPHVEKMITLGKRGDLSARRLAGSYLMTRESVSRLFETVAPRFGDRNGGYLRIIHKGWRAGDGAATCFIELLGSEKVIEAKRAKRAEVRTKRQEEVRKQMEEEQAAAAAAGDPEPAAGGRSGVGGVPGPEDLHGLRGRGGGAGRLPNWRRDHQY